MAGTRPPLIGWRSFNSHGTRRVVTKAWCALTLGKPLANHRRLRGAIPDLLTVSPPTLIFRAPREPPSGADPIRPTAFSSY